MTPLELGLELIERLKNVQLPSEEAARFRWPKCAACRRRPELKPQKGRWLIYLTGLKEEPRTLTVPRFEVFPCCSARLVKEVGPGKKLRLQLMANLEARKRGPTSVA